ncbi:MAG: hypothetical protein LUO94_09610 [Methylococcaceae bacterium]|nr:hypothetical protein [Methylococcaceae bacterium]
MIRVYVSSVSKSRSLTAQIRAVEQQIVIRQQGVGVRTATLIKKIHQEITAPSTLLLAGGIGFIIGELTKRPTTNIRDTADKQNTTETSPLRTALNLLTSMHTLYTALPIAWMLKSFQKPRGSSRQVPERRSQPVPAASGAVSNRRRSRRHLGEP